MKLTTNVAVAFFAILIDQVCTFTILPSWRSITSPTVLFPLHAQKKRKRKQPPANTDRDSRDVPSVSKQSPVTPNEEMFTDEDVALIRDVANFEFKPESIIIDPGSVDEVNQFKLPDIKDALRKKQIEEEVARMAEEERESKPKIKRSDPEAFKKLLQSNPFGDADDTLFEKEEYNAVSALLGEGAKPFLGIPIGPIQVGHFIGALGFILMAFVEYPGFPLTNLPTPVRECFQGVFGINAVLSIVAAFKAVERGQPVPLWVTKTLAVGGLAFDQLTQLPTLEDIKLAESVKGKRAAKKMKQ